MLVCLNISHPSRPAFCSPQPTISSASIPLLVVPVEWMSGSTLRTRPSGKRRASSSVSFPSNHLRLRHLRRRTRTLPRRIFPCRNGRSTLMLFLFSRRRRSASSPNNSQKPSLRRSLAYALLFRRISVYSFLLVGGESARVPPEEQDPSSRVRRGGGCVDCQGEGDTRETEEGES